MTLQGVIFDLDGVLVDTVPAHYAAWERLFREEGFHFDEAVYHDKVDGRPRRDGVAAVMEGESDARIDAAAARKDGFFLDLIEQGKFSVFDDAVGFLDQCRAMGLKLATASSSRNVRHILTKVGLIDRFAAVIGGDDILRGKPDPSIFLTAASRIGVPVPACAVIEDATSGVRAAKAGGFYCLGLDRAHQPARLDGADLIVNDLLSVTPEALAQRLAGGAG